MTYVLAFFRKECLEHWRSGRLLLLLALFCLFGVMNPAIAMLTPTLLEMAQESMSTGGVQFGKVTITALDAWFQFFKNIPMALAAFVLLESSCFTREYQSGTLVLALTKGLARPKVILAKGSLLMLLWTALYWLCAAITYAYSAYYWDNHVAQHLSEALLYWWLFGLMIVAFEILFSSIMQTNVGVLCATGLCPIVSFALGLYPPFSAYVPTALAKGSAIISGGALPDIGTPLLSIAITLLALIGAILCLNKKSL